MEETEIPGENHWLWTGDHYSPPWRCRKTIDLGWSTTTLSHDGARDRTLAVEVRYERANHCAIQAPKPLLLSWIYLVLSIIQILVSPDFVFPSSSVLNFSLVTQNQARNIILKTLAKSNLLNSYDLDRKHCRDVISYCPFVTCYQTNPKISCEMTTPVKSRKFHQTHSITSRWCSQVLRITFVAPCLVWYFDLETFPR